MKAKELMIGDFVRTAKDVCFYKGTIVQVRSIDGDNRFLEKNLIGCATCIPIIDDPDKMSCGVWVEYLEPIPLTPEILEKNGFNKVSQQDCVEPFYWQLKQYDEDENLLFGITAFRNFFNGLKVYIVNPSDCVTIHLTKQIESVHELQHALRLCGIDKEITLA